MNNKIIFLNDQWFWPIITGAFILLVVFIWKELVTPGRRRVILKIILSIFAIGGLALIGLKPAMPTSESSGKMVFLTPGYDESRLDSLKNAYPRLKNLSYSPQQPIPEELYKAEVVYLLGYGLQDYDLYQMENIPVFHLPGRSPQGVVKVRFPNKISVGESLNIRGLYRKPPSGNKLLLEGPGGIALDSLALNSEEEQIFKLTTEPKAAGNFVYYLTVKDPQGEVVTRDPLPLQVEEKAGLRILIINNFPTFETKYLKNFMAEAGHEVVVRSQITRGRFKYEYFNTGRTVIGSLSRETLEPYDLLILDAVSLRSLAGTQSRSIQNAVLEDGLGIFIQADEAFLNSPGDVVNLKFERHIKNEVKLVEEPEIEISVFPFAFSRSPELESIHTSENLILSGYKRMGQGRIGTAVFSNTWQLVLQGNSESYGQIWAQIIDQLGKREDLNVQFEPQDKFIFPDEPFHFKLRSNIPDPVITNADDRMIPLKQELNFSEQWKGTLWPTESGWNHLQQDTTAVFNYYVSGENTWNSLAAQNTLEANQRYFAQALEPGQGQIPVEPINPLYFYVLFLICMGGLWLEPKLS